MIAKPSASFWKDKRVFLTYPTSFLGAWTALVLKDLGAQVFGFSESSQATPNFFDLSNLASNISMTYGDLRDEETFRQVLQFAQADVVLHLGETGFLKKADEKPLDVFSKTIIGTTVLMELLRETASVRSIVVVSSDKVYERNYENVPLTEENKVAAREIHPTAKLCSEFVAMSYRYTFFNPEKYNKHKIALATARIENAIGGGDFTEGSLIYDAVKKFIDNKTFEVRNPNSVRPWIHVLDQVSGLLLLAQALYEKGPKLSPTYNFGATEYESVGEVMKNFSEIFGSTWTSVKIDEEKTAKSFHSRMNSDLAQKDLNWSPQWDLKKSLTETANWYRDYYSNR
ncbi:MAG: GDP-mannose 4,6-dehydratase [Bdellovibrio sp.]